MKKSNTRLGAVFMQVSPYLLLFFMEFSCALMAKSRAFVA
jgi:hypothetical protein